MTLEKQNSSIRVRDSRRAGHFWAYNSILDDHGPRIGAFGFAVYMALCRYARSGEVEVSLRKIARSLGISASKVHESVTALEKWGLIAIQEADDPTHQTPNRYVILETEEGVRNTNTPGNHMYQSVRDTNTGVLHTNTPDRPENTGVRNANANKECKTLKTDKTRSLPPTPLFEGGEVPDGGNVENPPQPKPPAIEPGDLWTLAKIQLKHELYSVPLLDREGFDGDAYDRYFRDARLNRIDDGIVYLESADAAATRVGLEKFQKRLQAIFRRLAGAEVEFRIAGEAA